MPPGPSVQLKRSHLASSAKGKRQTLHLLEEDIVQLQKAVVPTRVEYILTWDTQSQILKLFP